MFKSDPVIKKTNIVLEELDVSELNKLTKIIKPSNFKSLINNKIKKGKLISEVELYLNNEGNLKDFIAKGEIINLKAELLSDLNISKTSLSFFADKNDILIKKISGELEDIKISEGDIKINLEEGIKLSSNFNSTINFSDGINEKYLKIFSFAKNIENLSANFNNDLIIYLDRTYKLAEYNYKVSGKIEKSKLNFSPLVKNSFLEKEIKNIFLSDLKFESIFSPKKVNFNGEGNLLNNLNFLKLNFKNIVSDDLLNLSLDFDFKNGFEIGLINYKKTENSVARLSLDLEKKKKNILIKKLKYFEKDDVINIYGLKLKDNSFLSFKKIEIETKNNNFQIQNNKKILVKGSKFDATNLTQFLNKQNGEINLKYLNSEIEIDFKNIKVPMSEKLENFKLIGEMKKGKFIKISSKGDFGGNNFLDISMRKDKNTNRKYLEIYSDLTRPLLSQYNFFKGLSGGKLLFSSVIDDSKTTSKLKIENFKVINAPAVIKLLSLADLGGLVDLAEGEGLSFDLLEITMEKNEDLLKLNEILALGPSMSVLMEGYQSKDGLTSLRGTIVPAKTLNKIISKYQ